MTSGTRQPTVLTDDALRRYADAIVRSCVALRAGETLLVDCEPAHRELAIALASAAYTQGAVLVDVMYTDRRVQRARIADGPDAALGQVPPWNEARLRAAIKPNISILRIVGDEDPDILSGLDTARVATDFQERSRSLRWFQKAVISGRVRWSIVAWPTPSWAKRVYPELSAGAALTTTR